MWTTVSPWLETVLCAVDAAMAVYKLSIESSLVGPPPRVLRHAISIRSSSISTLSSPIFSLSSDGHLPYRYCHLPYRYCYLKVIFHIDTAIILSDPGHRRRSK